MRNYCELDMGRRVSGVLGGHGQVGAEPGEIQKGGRRLMVTEGSAEATLLSTGCREHPRQPRIKTAILTFLRKPSSLHICFTSFH